MNETKPSTNSFASANEQEVTDTQSELQYNGTEDESQEIITEIHLSPIIPYEPIDYEHREVGPHWIFPSGDDRDEGDFLDIDTIDSNDSVIVILNQDITVDPSQMILVPVVDGVVVPPRRCYLKIYGFRVCDDTFPCFFNPKASLLSLVTFFGILAGVLLLSNDPSQSQPRSPSSFPTFLLTHADDRRNNITEKLYAVSGNVLFEADSAQNRAMEWLIGQDLMNLTYTSPNVVQRYSCMVLFYSFSGEMWRNSEGYASGSHECDWFGIKCENGIGSNSNKVITKIEIQENNLMGELPKEIGSFPLLKRLYLHSNYISGSLPSEIGWLSRMERFFLHENILSGSIPTEIGTCRSLQKLILHLNKMTGSIPTSIWELHLLDTLDIALNKLVGTIDSNIHNLNFLSYLDMEENYFTGTIPSELGLMSLFELNLEKNDIEGTIPSMLSMLHTLRKLDLSSNKLTGTIPTELGELSKLEKMDLQRNRLSGTIPDSFGLLKKMVWMYLNDNMLNGTIPQSIGRLSELKKLNLHRNKISGEIGEEICELSFKALTADCNGEDSNVSCSCCTECY